MSDSAGHVPSTLLDLFKSILDDRLFPRSVSGATLVEMVHHPEEAVVRAQNRTSSRSR
jgi:hypothetical protein